jgi:hypothetical protein
LGLRARRRGDTETVPPRFFFTTWGCRIAAFLQKLPLRRGAAPSERLGLLSSR